MIMLMLLSIHDETVSIKTNIGNKLITEIENPFLPQQPANCTHLPIPGVI